MTRRISRYALVLLLAVAVAYVWFAHINYRFATVSEGRVYTSAAMPQVTLVSYISTHGIKTVIDLRDPGGARDALHPNVRKKSIPKPVHSPP